MPRPAVWSLYAFLVLVWSSTWVAIKIGLDDLPPLFGAGIRFGLAGVLLLAGAALAAVAAPGTWRRIHRSRSRDHLRQFAR